MDRDKITIEIASEPRHFCVVRAAAGAAAQTCKLSDAESGQVKLAVTEALANVANHGYKGERDGLISITLSPIQENGKRGLAIVIEDETNDVDLDQIRSRPLDEVRPGGLGVHIIHETMDLVEYRRRDEGTGVQLRMCKFADAAASFATDATQG